MESGGLGGNGEHDPEHGTGGQRDVGLGPGVGIEGGTAGQLGPTGAGWSTAPPGTVIDPKDPFGAGMRSQAAAFSKSLQDQQDANTARAINFGFNTVTGFTPAAALGLANSLSARFGGPTIGSLAAPGFRSTPGETIGDLSGRSRDQGPQKGGPEGSGAMAAQQQQERSLYEHPMLTQFQRPRQFAPRDEPNDSFARWVFRDPARS